MIFLTPFASLVFIHFLLGETLYATTFMGLALIVSGLLMQKFDPAIASRGQMSSTKGG